MQLSTEAAGILIQVKVDKVPETAEESTIQEEENKSPSRLPNHFSKVQQASYGVLNKLCYFITLNYQYELKFI